jgi:hypothetical protein
MSFFWVICRILRTPCELLAYPRRTAGLDNKRNFLFKMLNWCRSSVTKKIRSKVSENQLLLCSWSQIFHSLKDIFFDQFDVEQFDNFDVRIFVGVFSVDQKSFFENRLPARVQSVNLDWSLLNNNNEELNWVNRTCKLKPLNFGLLGLTKVK